MMVDAIRGPSPKRVEVARGSVDRGAAPAKAGTVASQGAASLLSPASQMAAAGAPVDSDKVAAIRAAIAAGRYPVDPERIAASMLALDLPSKEAE